MMRTSDFDARAWIANNISEAEHLNDGTWNSVAALTILWNQFERTLCGRKACIAEFEKLCSRVKPADDLPEPLQEAWRFWQKRYTAGQEASPLFDMFHFADNHRKEDVREILLKGDAANSTERVFAVMLIVYRLRNNMFHGEKEVVTLDSQRENFQVASLALASFLEAFK